MTADRSIATIRGARDGDIAMVVRVHMAAFPGFYLTELGPAFLKRYYRLILEQPHNLFFVAEVDGALTGFVAGFQNPAAFYRKMSASKWRLALPIARGLAGNPRLLARSVKNVFRVRTAQREPAMAGTEYCELSSIGVAPEQGKRGLGTLLVQEFVAASRKAGVKKLSLTTDAHGNDAVNRFYQRLGFQAGRLLERSPGRVMREYVMVFENATAVPTEAQVS